MEECRERVEQALSSPAESRDSRRNMQLYATLGAALFLTKGSCPEMLAAFTSALEIAESLDDSDYRLRALWGLFVESFTSGRYRGALAVAERFCTDAAKTNDPADGPIGDRLVGVAPETDGEFQYRIKSTEGTHERVAKETDTRTWRSEGAGGGIEREKGHMAITNVVLYGCS